MTSTLMVGRVAETLGVGPPVPDGLGVDVPDGLADGVADPSGGVVSAEAVQPVRPTMTMAPAYATRLTLSTAAPHFAVLHPSIHQNCGCRPS
ncbi:hypothetical protein HII36_15405 [Nonomuraea sp. NN258]|uniref:hypothetical protein n=1 Tax=Nonomuraea antri TaxID=2730852 RepID=UPI001568DA4D|nr:hypothetical protein [Nonomuraea antri]NRQ33221.1 hypothetical protein [Nonomuraea antri]